LMSAEVAVGALVAPKPAAPGLTATGASL